MLLTTFFNDLNASKGGAETVVATTWYAAQFSTDNSTYDSLTATLLMSQVTAGTLILDLYADAGQQPGAFVGTFTNPSSFNSTLTAEPFTAGGLSLSANTNYWLVLHAATGSYNWGWTGDFTIKQNWTSSSDSGATWSKSNSYPFQYSVVSGISIDTAGDKIGIQRGNVWYLDSNDTFSFEGEDSVFSFGNVGDVPLKGDWNADGFDEIGVFRNGLWYLDVNGNNHWDGTSGGDVLAKFGAAGDLPIVGDWNGDNFDEIGVVRDRHFYLDFNGDRAWNGLSGDLLYTFGNATDLPVAGDWTNTGRDSIGVFRNGVWYLDANSNGTWDGHATGDATFSFGIAGDHPLIGDWNSDGVDDVGIVRGRNWYLDTNGSRFWDGNSGGDSYFTYGNATGDVPLAGKWRSITVTAAKTMTANSAATSSAAPSERREEVLASQLAAPASVRRAATTIDVNAIDELFAEALAN
ncbi:MAG: choice-of-anchor R domain-containing protein [Planctomycetales bacterium]